jgi:hypothetical protein
MAIVLMQLSSIQQIRTIKLKAATLLFPKGVNSIGLGFPLGLWLKPISNENNFIV